MDNDDLSSSILAQGKALSEAGLTDDNADQLLAESSWNTMGTPMKVLAVASVGLILACLAAIMLALTYAAVLWILPN